MLQELRLKIIETIESARNSKLLIYIHDDPMSYKHIPLIYNKLDEMGRVENLDIFIQSEGGDPEAAYKIVTMLREYCKNKLSLIVPLKAKSTATLIALGVDEILMGATSELGPIEPQLLDSQNEIWGSTQYLRDSMDYIQSRMFNLSNPKNASNITLPLLDKLHPFLIGKNERLIKSAKQYSKILLAKGMLAHANESLITEVVNKLNESFYPHGYPINRTEAKHELFLNVVQCNDKLWHDIWSLFSTYNYEMETNKQHMLYIETAGSIKNDITVDITEALNQENENNIKVDFSDYTIHKDGRTNYSDEFIHEEDLIESEDDNLNEADISEEFEDEIE